MDPEAIALFRELADRSPSDREEYFAQHKVPAALRAEVESLLRFDGDSVDPLHGYVAAAAKKVLFEDPGAALPPRLALEQGSKLGPYQVISLIGAGGMGEVYRAHDSRLGRDVAIKILRRAFTGDADRLRRFEQEARAAAALNHPNVLAIHDVGRTEQQTPYLVTELLEGETLRSRLTSGALPLRLTLDYALQMIRGLAAAHDKGIVHRDLKPENVFITADGRIKILDLGLAKLTRPEQPSPDAVTGGTVDGVVMGTVGYMSPEQALGQRVDHRTDIFAAGAIIYEMLASARAFPGETPADVMRAVISQDPADVSVGNRSVPPALVRIVERCLAKNPDHRFQSARDMVFALETSELDAQLQTDRATAHRVSWLSTRRRVVTIGVAASIVLLGAAIYLWRSRGAAPTSVSLEDLQIVQLTTSGLAERPAISPDGRYVAYILHDGDRYSLRIRQITTGSDVEIVGAEPGVALAGVTVTPDGNFVDFVRRLELWRVPFLGGRPRLLIKRLDSPVGWSRDGRHMAFIRTLMAQKLSELVIANADGSQERVLAARRGPMAFYSLFNAQRPNMPPAWSFDGRRLAALEWNGSTDQVAVFDVATSAEQSIPVKGAATGLAWLDAESFVLNISPTVEAASQLVRLSFPDGRISRLSNDPNTYEGVSITADGTSLVTTRSETRVGIWAGDGTGRKGSDATPLTPYLAGASGLIAWASDRVLYATAGAGGFSISRVVPGKGPPEEIVPLGAQVATSWDGQTLVFSNVKTESLWKADSDGHGAVELVPKAQLASTPVTTPDRHVVFLSVQGDLQSPWIVSLDGGSPREITHTFVAVGSLDVSSDGEFIVFRTRNERDMPVWMICKLPTCTMPRTLPAVGRPSPLRWTPDGNSVAYVDAGAPANIWVRPLDGRAPYQLTDFTDRTIVDFAWSRDGKQLAIARASTTNDIVLFKGLKK